MTAAHKNQYEELIDEIMINEVSGIDSDIRKTLKNLSTNKKRMAILSILDKDRDMFLKIKNTVKDNKVSKAEHIKLLVEQLRAYVTVGDFEKKSVGEVQTPWVLVQDLLNSYPKEVWSNPNLKWLDNSTGTGILIAGVVERLMTGLNGIISDDEERYKHIIENMIYVSELQAKNCFLFLISFDPNDEYGINIYNGSFLNDGFNNHMKDVWGLDTFDCIISNPPYQTSNEGEKKTHPIWDKFVKKSFDVLIENGYMVNVHPSGWRNIDGRFKEIQKMLIENELLTLVMCNTKVGFETFGANIDYDFYCVKKNININNFTSVIDYNKNQYDIFLKNKSFIPNSNLYDVYSLVAKEGEEKVEVLYSRSDYGTDKNNMSKEQTNEHIHPCAYTVGRKNPNFWWSNVNNGVHFNIPKVIWGNGLTDVIIDETGQYGLTQFAYAIVDEKNNLKNIQEALKSDRFIKNIMGYTKGVGHIYNRKIISTFRKDFWKEFIK